MYIYMYIYIYRHKRYILRCRHAYHAYIYTYVEQNTLRLFFLIDIDEINSLSLVCHEGYLFARFIISCWVDMFFYLLKEY